MAARTNNRNNQDNHVNGHVPPVAMPEEIDMPISEAINEMVRFNRQQIGGADYFQRAEIRSVCDAYYSIQKTRMRIGNQEGAIHRSVDVAPVAGEAGQLMGLRGAVQVGETEIVTSLKHCLKHLEEQTAKVLARYANSCDLGRWCLRLNGVGPITVAAMLAHVDFHSCQCREYREIPRKDRPNHECQGLVTAGGLRRFAGLDPSAVWNRGQKRPHNARLKTVLWNLGEGFKRLTVAGDKQELSQDEFINNFKRPEGITDAEFLTRAMKGWSTLQKRKERFDDPASLYVRLYVERKKILDAKNQDGGFRELAAAKLERARTRNARLTEPQRACWENGRVQDCGANQMAQNYAVKMFLDHYFFVGSVLLGRTPCVPWSVAFGGHSHQIAPPCFDRTEYRRQPDGTLASEEQMRRNAEERPSRAVG